MNMLKQILLDMALKTLIVLHHIIVILIVTLPIWIWFLVSPVTASILSLLAIWRIASKAVCPLTVLENSLRKSLGLPIIKTFVGHYYMKHVYKYIERQIGGLL